MQDLKITIIQTSLAWEDPEENMRALGKTISGITDNTDLIILPEMFTTGFTVEPSKFAEENEGRSLEWMKKMASRETCAITGSFIVKDKNDHYNRLYWVNPDGSFQSYDKRHLFRMGNEHLRFSHGAKRLVVNYKGWKIFPLICYDLRFPVWSKNRYGEDGYEFDLMIYTANWPSARSHVWKSLLVARAIENISFVAGVNRIGEDGNKIQYSGDSMIIYPDGKTMFASEPDEITTRTLVLSYEQLEKTRNKFQVGLDWDNFVIEE
jgi:predicted amidohydrolase